MSELRKQALALYKPPFIYIRGYVYDSNKRMVADDVAEAFTRVRGWGRIQYMENSEKLQDEFGAIMAEALNEFYEKESFVQKMPSKLTQLERDQIAICCQSAQQIIEQTELAVWAKLGANQS